MKPKISVIIPVYNTTPVYLKYALKSVLEQQTELFELIIIDDGSKNKDTLEVLAETEKYDNVTVYHIENGGVSAARNFGIDKANGEYIVFVDADDGLTDGAIKTLCENNNQADIICFDYCKNYGNRVENIYYREESEMFCNENCKKILEDSLVVENGLALCWGKAFKREFLINNALYFDKELVLAEDAEFAIRCYSAAQTICYLREILYVYTVSVGSAVRRFNAQMPDIYNNGMQKILLTINRLNSERLNKRAYNFVLFHLLLIVVNNVFHPNNPLGFFAKFRRLKEICNSGCYKTALRYADYSLFSKTRAITLFLIKHNLYLPVFLIAKIRQSTRKD